MKFTLRVSQNGHGDFKTIQEAVDSIPYSQPAVICIKNGTYREKVRIEKKNLSLIGEDTKHTVITFSDSAFQKNADGRPNGTFRSSTVFASGEKIVMQNLTIENTAGVGETAGQAIALYADAERSRFYNVRLLGHQDTLFLAPLPEQPRTPGGFVGPRENTPRKACTAYFERCRIEGDVDFIFGGACAAFVNCDIYSHNLGQSINGYITAASTPQHQKDGLIFYKCRLRSDCAPGTVYLGRPWREYACVAFLECELGAHIHPQGWARWNDRAQDDNTVRFAEAGCFGTGAHPKRAPWANTLNEEQVHELLQTIEKLDEI